MTMERRETYDPEDIESLLNERSFDELLAEERAFVLRHISGRDEYENMRRLLHHVQEDERGPKPEPITADPAIRERLLQMYRDRKQPGWQIWLNSVQAFLFPKEASAFWRPALAVATVALVITGAVVGYQRLSNADSPELAALEEKAAVEKPAQPAAAGTEKEEVGPEDKAIDALQSATVQLQAAGSTRNDLAASKDVSEGLAELKNTWKANADGGYVTESLDAVAADEAPASGSFDMKIPTSAPAADSTLTLEFAPAPTADNYVQREDLERNGTLTNATGAVAREEMVLSEVAAKEGRMRRAKAEKSLDEDSRSLAQDQQLLDLLNAAW